MKVVKEGLCELILPETVFYNPVQEFNRDLTILAISSYITYTNENPLPKMKIKRENGFKILDALSATGMRAIRYAKEILGIQFVIANDLSQPAIQVIKNNVQHNGVENLVQISHDDANLVMLNHTSYSDRFDVVDLDPYGSAVPFMSAAFQSINHGGLLCVTCTDMGVLCGATGHNCYGRYDAIPYTPNTPTKWYVMSLRIVLHSLESHANKHNKYIVPLVSLSIDFYVRLFVLVYEGAAQVHQSAAKRSLVYHCNGCTTFTLQPMASLVADSQGNKKFKHAGGPLISSKCSICSSPLQLGGPIWSEPIYDKAFVKRMLTTLPNLQLGTKERIEGLLAVVSEELLDVPLYYKLDRLSSALNMGAPKMLLVKSALINAGYRVSISHASPNSIKTDAPHNVLWDILRCWAKKNDMTADKAKQDVAKRILSQTPEIEADFGINPLAIPDSVKQQITRFPELPPNWGPQSKVAVVKRLKSSSNA